jgi:hypothetical protein
MAFLTVEAGVSSKLTISSMADTSARPVIPFPPELLPHDQLMPVILRLEFAAEWRFFIRGRGGLLVVFIKW